MVKEEEIGKDLVYIFDDGDRWEYSIFIKNWEKILE